MTIAVDRNRHEPLREIHLGRAIELTPVDALLTVHQNTIGRLIDCIAPETSELEDAIVRTLAQFTAWVHQLPASETHHHSYLGGLLEHSLEVALWSAESARSRLGDLKLPGWERRRQERTFVLAVALSGLLHDLGKPVADLLIHDPRGRIAWNPYRGSLMAWAEAHGLSHYHLQWLKGRGARHRGFSLLILRNVVEPALFDRLREVGPELEASLLGALSQEGAEDDPAFRLVTRADQESAIRSLRDPRRYTDFGGPSPENILVHAMRHLVHQGIWIPNLPGSALWVLEAELYLSWPRAAGDLQTLIDQDRFSGIPLEPDLLMAFMQDRGLLAPLVSKAEIPSPILSLQPDTLDFPLRLLKLRSPRLLFEGVLPESLGIRRNDTVDPPRRDDDAPPRPILSPDSVSLVISHPAAPEMACDAEKSTPQVNLKSDLQNASDRYEWQIRDHHLFIPHPETARALGIEPLSLIESLEAEDWLEPGGSGNLRKVRIVEGRRGLLLTRTVSTELLKAMKVPKRKSRRKIEVTA